MPTTKSKPKNTTSNPAPTVLVPPPIPVLPNNWPSSITYLYDQTYTPAVTPEQRAALGITTLPLPRIPTTSLTAPYRHLAIRPITDPAHPAHPQLGLFAATPLPPDAFVCLYLGRVHTNALADSDAASDYDLSLDRELGLSIDAARAGNESRCINDYRGVPSDSSGAGAGATATATGPNAEFRDCLVKVACGRRAGGEKWERRVGVFVLSAGKARKRSAGIASGQEVLVSYGKGFWDGRKTVDGDGVGVAGGEVVSGRAGEVL